jgi:hypothetical protein
MIILLSKIYFAKHSLFSTSRGTPRIPQLSPHDVFLKQLSAKTLGRTSLGLPQTAGLSNRNPADLLVGAS